MNLEIVTMNKVDTHISTVTTRGVQGPASTDPPARNRPDRRSTGGSESTYGRSRIGKKTTRIFRFGSGFQNISPGKPKPTELVIIKKKKKRKKSRIDISDSVICVAVHQNRTAHALPSPRLKAYTFPTWTSAVHHKIKFKMNGVDEVKLTMIWPVTVASKPNLNQRL